MSKTLALAIILVFLTASSTILAMPVSGATAGEHLGGEGTDASSKVWSRCYCS